jgi:hypothetical protein
VKATAGFWKRDLSPTFLGASDFWKRTYSTLNPALCHAKTLKSWKSQLVLYLQLNKKKAKADGEKCHAKTMKSKKAGKTLTHQLVVNLQLNINQDDFFFSKILGTTEQHCGGVVKH